MLGCTICQLRFNDWHGFHNLWLSQFHVLTYLALSSQFLSSKNWVVNRRIKLGYELWIFCNKEHLHMHSKLHELYNSIFFPPKTTLRQSWDNPWRPQGFCSASNLIWTSDHERRLTDLLNLFPGSCTNRKVHKTDLTHMGQNSALWQGKTSSSSCTTTWGHDVFRRSTQFTDLTWLRSPGVLGDVSVYTMKTVTSLSAKVTRKVLFAMAREMPSYLSESTFTSSNDRPGEVRFQMILWFPQKVDSRHDFNRNCSIVQGWTACSTCSPSCKITC